MITCMVLIQELISLEIKNLIFFPAKEGTMTFTCRGEVWLICMGPAYQVLYSRDSKDRCGERI